jgi:hypothetical protein
MRRSGPPVTEETPEARAYKRGFRQKNKRDDYALDLFHEARAKLATDRRRVERILGELSRLYNPLANGPIVDLATCAAIMTRLDTGRIDEAGDLLERRYQLYAPLDDAERGAPGTPGV